MISHIVLFEPRENLSASDFLLFAQQLQVVIRNVPGIRRASIGRSVAIDSGQRRNFGDNTYSFSAVLDFDDAQDLIRYLNHPDHHALGKLFWEYCKATVVLEVEAIDGLTGEVTKLLVKNQN